jgi:CheY-like chemotaxis protein
LPFPSEQTPSSAARLILIVEDNPADVYLIRRAITAGIFPAGFHVVSDGHQAIEFFDEVESDAAKSCPDVVILDINLPKKQGADVLRNMRKRSRCANARVIVVSTSELEGDRAILNELGADVYFRKPSDLDEFMKLGEIVKGLLAADAEPRGKEQAGGPEES